MLALLFVVLALAVVLAREIKKNKALKNSVAELEKKVTRPFGLTMLEAVGRLLGGLTTDVVRATYAAAAVDGRPITVPADLARERERWAGEILKAQKLIVALKARIADSQRDLEEVGARVGTLTAIGTLLPKS